MNDSIEAYRLAICKVNAVLPVFVNEVRATEFGKPFRVTSIAALADSARQVLSTAMEQTEDDQPYLDAGDKVVEVLWGIGEQMQDITDTEERSDLCWGLLEGMEELLKRVGLMSAEAGHSPPANLPPSISRLPGEHGRRGVLARRAGCAISDLAMALTKLMEDHQTAELTLIRRIESLSGVVISAADEDHSDLEYLEGMLTDSP